QNFFNARTIQSLLEYLSLASSCRGIVMDNGNLFTWEMLHNIIGLDNTLLIVTSTGAEHIIHTRFCEGWVCSERRHHQDTLFVINLGSRDCAARAGIAYDK